MVEQCLEFSPRYAVMDDEASAKLLKTMLQQQGSRTEVLSGQQAACDMAALEDVDQVMAAIVGAAGLLPTLAAIRAGKTILLANKESLVTCGRLFMDAVKQSKAQLLPVDSEHNAIFRVYRNLSSIIWDTLTLSKMAWCPFYLPGLVALSVRRHCAIWQQ